MKRMHKLVSILTAAMMLLSTAALPVSAADVLTGDLDGSGEVTLTDAVQLAKAAAGTGEALSAEGRLAADVNSDGEVNSTDLAWLLQYLAGTRTSLGTEEVSYRSAVDLTADIVSGKVASKSRMRHIPRHSSTSQRRSCRTSGRRKPTRMCLSRRFR